MHAILKVTRQLYKNIIDKIKSKIATETMGHKERMQRLNGTGIREFHLSVVHTNQLCCFECESNIAERTVTDLRSIHTVCLRDTGTGTGKMGCVI